MSKPRKVHKKSRYGCDNCRRRRVKCDELGPPCTNCILRQISDCTYSRILPASLIANARRESHDTPESTTIPPSPSGGSPRHEAVAVDELELMHHFATETYQTLCVSDSEARTWQVLVPRLALKHRYLMNGILSLASLHIATLREPPEALAYIDAGLSYHSLSLEPFRIAVGNLTAENCEAAFAQSIVTTAISLALPQLTTVRDNPAATAAAETVTARMTDHILTIFELLQGVKQILTLSRPHMTLDLFSQGSFWRKDKPGTLPPETAEAFSRLAALNESTVSLFFSLEQSAINADAITYLRYCFTKFLSAPEPDPAPVLAWLGAVDPGFVESLRRRESVSLLVLAYWGVLLVGLDGIGQRWWARGAGRALLNELVDGLGEGHGREWREYLGCLGWVRGRMEEEVKRLESE
ncbi:hypothetical protein BJX70DRAFT_204916 [Aspergillus crustosus]